MVITPAYWCSLVYRRFRRWSEAGVWETVAVTLAEVMADSGHYSIDACDVSQFELQVRAMCGLPLVAPRLHSPSVMLNLLGDLWFGADGRELAWIERLDQLRRMASLVQFVIGLAFAVVAVGIIGVTIRITFRSTSVFPSGSLVCSQIATLHPARTSLPR